MKSDNLDPRLRKYRITFNRLHIPLLAITQLFAAFYRAYISSSLNYGLGMPRSFVSVFYQFSICLMFLILSLITRRSFKINIKSIPFVIITGLIYVAISHQLLTRSQISNGSFITACYQPMVVALSTFGALLLKYEPPTFLKISGITICLLATLSRLFFDRFNDTYEGKQFVGKFYVFNQMIFASIGTLLQKKLISVNKKTSLLVIVFYVYFCGFLCSIIIYNIKYYNDTYNVDSKHNTKETFTTYYTFDYLRILSNIGMVWITYIICEGYRFVTLLYIVREGQISKVVLYGSLHGFYVVIIYIIFEKTIFFDYIFIALITIGYLFVYFSKYTENKVYKKEIKAKKSRVKFMRIINEQEQANLLVSGSKIEMDGEYFYQSHYQKNVERQTMYQGIDDTTIVDTYYSHKPESSRPPAYVINSIDTDDNIDNLYKTSQPNNFKSGIDMESNEESKDGRNLLQTQSNQSKDKRLSNMGTNNQTPSDPKFKYSLSASSQSSND